MVTLYFFFLELHSLCTSLRLLLLLFECWRLSGIIGCVFVGIVSRRAKSHKWMTRRERKGEERTVDGRQVGLSSMLPLYESPANFVAVFVTTSDWKLSF